MKMRSTCASSCQHWGTSLRGCTGSGARQLHSETGTAASPEPWDLTAGGSKIGSVELCFVLFFSLHFLVVHFFSPAPAFLNTTSSHCQRIRQAPGVLSCNWKYPLRGRHFSQIFRPVATQMLDATQP